MRISARNVLSGKVVAITKGATTAHVKIESARRRSSPPRSPTKLVEALGLEVGKPASAVIKASDVMVAIDDAARGSSGGSRVRALEAASFALRLEFPLCAGLQYEFLAIG